MKLTLNKQTLTTEASVDKNGFNYSVNFTQIDGVLSTIAVRVMKDNAEMGMQDCGYMNKDDVNTYINLATGVDVFEQSGIFRDICIEIEALNKKKN